LRREGWQVNRKLVYRPYCEAGLGDTRDLPQSSKRSPCCAAGEQRCRAKRYCLGE